MDEEIKTFIKVLGSTAISITYCYYLSSRIKAGVLQLLSVLPICALFLVFPLFFSSSFFNLSTSLSLSWLANFKLVFFAFDKGPLFPLPQISCNSSASLLSPSLLNKTLNPIKFQNTHLKIIHINGLFPIKVLIFSMALHMYDYTQDMPPLVLSGFYLLHMYLSLDVLLTTLTFLVIISLGFDLEPPFIEPYLATSLQDFWGHRWNLITSGLLRLTVFNPVRKLCEHLINKRWPSNVGILATFLASGVIHEVIFLYLTGKMPTGEVTCFFVLHGVCRVVETTVKRMKFTRRCVVSPVVSRVLTVEFVIVTGDWLFFPLFKRNGVMESLSNETLLLFDFVKRSVFIPLLPFAK